MLARVWLLVLSLFPAFVQAEAFGTLDPFWADFRAEDVRVIEHSSWQRFLDAHVVAKGQPEQTFVSYQRVSKAELAELQAYLFALQAVAIRGYNRDEQKAFWINLYNAKTAELVLSHYPVDSIRDIKFGWFSSGPWSEKLLSVEGKSLSLDDIEHHILRPVWRDNRIHYAVNCASRGCPNLARQAYTGANAESLLQMAAIEFINHSRGMSMNGNEAVLSSIYKWYADDFGEDFTALKKHLSLYARPALAARLETLSDVDYDYDWRLNEAH